MLCLLMFQHIRRNSTTRSRTPGCTSAGPSQHAPATWAYSKIFLASSLYRKHDNKRIENAAQGPCTLTLKEEQHTSQVVQQLVHLLFRTDDNRVMYGLFICSIRLQVINFLAVYSWVACDVIGFCCTLPRFLKNKKWDYKAIIDKQQAVVNSKVSLILYIS